jgi:hypothetical protein
MRQDGWSWFCLVFSFLTAEGGREWPCCEIGPTCFGPGQVGAFFFSFFTYFLFFGPGRVEFMCLNSEFYFEYDLILKFQIIYNITKYPVWKCKCCTIFCINIWLTTCLTK